MKSREIDFNFLFVVDKQSHKNKISIFENESFLSVSTFIYEKGINAIIPIWNYLKKTKPEVIIIGGFPIYIISILLRKIMFKYRLIIWWGGTIQSENRISWLKKMFRKFSMLFVDGAIYYSKLSQDYLCSLKGKIEAERILGNNTRNYESFKIKMETISLEISKIFRIVTVGFQFERKNTVLLIQAISELKNKNNIQLIVVGDGPELNNLKALSKKRGVQVIFTGQISPEETLYYYKNSDLFVHPSHLDLWPQTYSEALCAGLPILISDTSGVFDGYTEKFGKYIFFQSTSVDSLKRVLIQVMENKNLLEELRVGAQNVAKNNDGIKAMRIFEEIVLMLN